MDRPPPVHQTFFGRNGMAVFRQLVSIVSSTVQYIIMEKQVFGNVYLLLSTEMLITMLLFIPCALKCGRCNTIACYLYFNVLFVSIMRANQLVCSSVSVAVRKLIAIFQTQLSLSIQNFQVTNDTSCDLSH